MSKLMFKNATGLHFPDQLEADDLECIAPRLLALKMIKNWIGKKAWRYRSKLKRVRFGLVYKPITIIRRPSGVTFIKHAQMGYTIGDIRIIKTFPRCLNPSLRMFYRRKRLKFGDKR